MPTALRSFAAWIAVACIAFGSLLPLASLAATKMPSSAMAICSTGAGWQNPGSTPNQAAHNHCAYCSNAQPYMLHLPRGKIAAFRATTIYLIAQAPQHEELAHVSRADNRARAPPA